MAFFNQMGGGTTPGLGGGGMGGSPSAFTSPGLDPMTLAMLLRMQGGGMGAPGGAAPGGMGGAPGGMPPSPPQMPPPPGGGMGMMPHPGMGMPPAMPPGAAAAPPGVAAALQQPNSLMQLLGSLGMNQGGGGQGSLMQLLQSLRGGAASQGGAPGLANNPQFAGLLNSMPDMPFGGGR